MNDMRDMLFAQMRRLADPSCNLDKEVLRTGAMVEVTGKLIDSAKVEVDFMRVTGAVSTEFMPIIGQIAPEKGHKLLGDGNA